MSTTTRSLAALTACSLLMLGSCGNGRDPGSVQQQASADSSASQTTSGTVSANSSSSASSTATEPSATGPNSGTHTTTHTKQATAAATAQASATPSEIKAAIGTIFMIGVQATGASQADLKTLKSHKVSNVFLRGRSQKGVTGTHTVTAKIRTSLSSSIGKRHLVIATDQEGGYVQVLQGTGFSKIPTALIQGGYSDTKLQAKAKAWGAQLAKAGIDLNLAPVGDTVKSAQTAKSNAPIGYFSRQYGYAPKTIARKTASFSKGMRSSGVGVAIKHFPGLGYVKHNTDTTLGVKDTVTTTTSASLAPFKDSIARGEHWIMVSNAIYTKIDSKNVAAFSSKINKDLLREKLGFEGIIISDDLCSAKAVSDYAYSTRARKFFTAGGTMFLCVDATKGAKAMDGLYKAALKEPKLAATLLAAAKKVNEHVGR